MIEAKAKWIWFPGDFELWLHARVMMRRDERGMYIPPIWKIDLHHPNVKFRKVVELERREAVEIAANGRFNVMVNGQYLYDARERFELEAGRNEIVVSIMNDQSLPTIFVRGASVLSDETWSASYQNNKWTNAASWIFDRPEEPPVSYRLATERISPTQTSEAGPHARLLDFGRQTFGFVELHGIRGRGRVYVFYGESEAEAMSETHCETFDIADIEEGETGLSFPLGRAFRYVRVRTDPGLFVERVDALYEYLPLEYRGTFRCSDPVLNEIWDVSVRTLHLNTREFFLDGIKRDRWVWSGDAYQSFLMNYYSFFDNAVCRRTLVAVRGGDPVEIHLNTILDYSFYWIISLEDYALYTNDLAFVRMMYPKLKTLLEFCLGRVNAEGMIEGVPGEDWVFVDWAEMGKEGELCVEQILLCRSLEAAGGLARKFGDIDAAERYDRLAGELKEKLLDVFWDEEQGGLVHSRVNGKLNRHMTKYANLFAVLFGYLSPERTAIVKREVLTNDRIQPITTPYMRFHELACLCELGEQAYVRQEMLAYWGGMLKLGATSFWEEYDPSETGEAHYAMYGRPFGKSLCHAWGASPIYLLGKYYLGVRPTAPGYEAYIVQPNLGGLERLEGCVPTPRGTVEVYADATTLRVRPAQDGDGRLRFRSAEPPVSSAGTITRIGTDEYELVLEPAAPAYEVRYAAARGNS
ncbi:alpha-rhamnosidase [Paenibacillaceae bacterium WGS1546]|uniref:alpha-L-rhamnosidase-related protein n=1 Tax=Cohnella sp. WGS1546 TaxID=3366810 RepID=UPI00372D2A99